MQELNRQLTEMKHAMICSLQTMVEENETVRADIQAQRDKLIVEY